MEIDLILPCGFAGDDAQNELFSEFEDLLDPGEKGIQILREFGVVAGVDLARLDGVHQRDETSLDVILHAMPPGCGRLERKSCVVFGLLKPGNN